MKTRIVVADFGVDTSPKFYRNLYNTVKDLDISIVMANAGLLLVNYWMGTSMRQSTLMMDVNMYHYMMMHKIFIPKLLDRTKAGKRCAFIAVASVSWLRQFPSPMHTYSGTKVFTGYLSRAFIKELHDMRAVEQEDGS